MEARVAAGGTRMRMLETVRQYGLEQLEAAGETAVVHDRHLAWCSTAVEARATMSEQLGDLDLVAMEVRAAIGRRWGDPPRRAAACDVARRVGDLMFTTGRPGGA